MKKKEDITIAAPKGRLSLVVGFRVALMARVALKVGGGNLNEMLQPRKMEPFVKKSKGCGCM
ncbi:MAG: hypothetical protein M0R80_03610 [Proteobacteria bacterium]|nr:hypothetical protein [Pseudomonadota bacterium]